jgi:hypothetical protein
MLIYLVFKILLEVDGLVVDRVYILGPIDD